ncbi:MAG: hypothetical protein FJ276_27305 [Planctomycetes bacterium]|nr:hypothetical protein [Planctomycetota bacterium]
MTPLFSPAVTPQCNAACEAGNGAMKLRTHEQAALGGFPLAEFREKIDKGIAGEGMYGRGIQAVMPHFMRVRRPVPRPSVFARRLTRTFFDFANQNRLIPREFRGFWGREKS